MYRILDEIRTPAWENIEGLCAWEKCGNPVTSDEHIGGYGPLVIGYMCEPCFVKFAARIQKENEEWMQQDDARLIRDLIACAAK
jgi:hypothetical protein